MALYMLVRLLTYSVVCVCVCVCVQLSRKHFNDIFMHYDPVRATYIAFFWSVGQCAVVLAVVHRHLGRCQMLYSAASTSAVLSRCGAVYHGDSARVVSLQRSVLHALRQSVVSVARALCQPNRFGRVSGRAHHVFTKFCFCNYRSRRKTYCAFGALSIVMGLLRHTNYYCGPVRGVGPGHLQVAGSKYLRVTTLPWERRPRTFASRLSRTFINGSAKIDLSFLTNKRRLGDRRSIRHGKKLGVGLSMVTF